MEDPTGFTIEVIEAMKGSAVTTEDIESEKHEATIHAMNNKGNKTYYITKSVIDKLQLLDTKKCMDIEGWKLFSHLPDFKKTYILPDMPDNYSKYGGSGYVRVAKYGDIIFFVHVSSKFLPPAQRTPTNDSSMYIVMLYVDLSKGKDGMCPHWNSNDGKGLAPFLFSLMCFVELCENETIVVEPKAKYGTLKQGKIINTLPCSITVINNTWNVTKIMTGDIPVIGHAQVYWTGQGRQIPKLIFKEPFVKQGYTRISGKELDSKVN